MINSVSLIKRKLFFEPLVRFTTNDPMYEGVENYLDGIFKSEDKNIIIKKEKFLSNISNIHRAMVNPGDADLRVFLYFNIPLWIFAGFFFIFMFATDFLPNAGVGGPLILFVIIFLIGRPFYVAYSFLKGYNELKRREKQFIETNIFLEKASYPDIWEPIWELSAKIGIDINRIKLLYVKENHFIPTVTDLKRLGTKLIVITIPRNLLVLAGQKPEIYKSIIAHELSHLTQGDSGIWMYYYLDFICAYNLYDFLLNLIQGKKERLRKKYKDFNSSAEYLADLGSIILTQDTRIMDFLKGDYISNLEGDFHPTRNERINFLKAFLYKQAQIAFK